MHWIKAARSCTQWDGSVLGDLEKLLTRQAGWAVVCSCYSLVYCR